MNDGLKCREIMYFINGVLEFERFHQQQQDFVCKFHLLVDRPAKEAPKVGPASRCFCVGLKQFESCSQLYIQDTDFDIVDIYIFDMYSLNTSCFSKRCCC